MCYDVSAIESDVTYTFDTALHNGLAYDTYVRAYTFIRVCGVQTEETGTDGAETGTPKSIRVRLRQSDSWGRGSV